VTSRSIAILVVLLLAFAARAQTSVVLGRGVRVDVDRPVTLGDVAEITGDDAERLGAIVLIPDLHAEHVSSEPFDVDIERVRQVLDREDQINWALVSLSGSTCRIIQVDQAELDALRHIVTDPAADAAPARGPTLRDAIRWRLAAHFGVDHDDLRLGFDVRDAKKLAALTLGRQVEVTPTGESDKMPLRYTIYDGDRIEQTGILSVRVTIRREVVVAREALGRGDIIDLTLVAVEHRWVGPSVSPASPRNAIGNEIRASVPAGAVIERSTIDEPVVVRRGDRVVIECVTGGFVVKSEAWALESGRDGEIIRFKSVGDPKGEHPFNARLHGTGRAVAVLYPTIGPLPQEGTQQ